MGALDILEEIIADLSGAQKRQYHALRKLSYLQTLLPPGHFEQLEELDSKLREVIKINNQLLSDFEQSIETLKTQIQRPRLDGASGRYSVSRRYTQSSPSVQYPNNFTRPHRRPPDSIIQKLCQTYNAAIEDPQQKNEFIQRCKPVRIGVTNAMARYQNLNIEPIFQTTSDGDYFAVAIDGDTRYAVVPRFDLTFQESIYGPGAMGQVFECPNYNSQWRYPRVKVVKPAFFELDSAKQCWTLKEKGELDLGQGE